MSVYKSLEVQFNMLLHSIYDFPIVPNNKQMFIGTWNIFVQISYYHQADLWSPHLPPQTHTRPYPGSIRWVKDDNYHIASSQKRCKTSKMDWGARFFFSAEVGYHKNWTWLVECLLTYFDYRRSAGSTKRKVKAPVSKGGVGFNTTFKTFVILTYFLFH